MAKQLLAHSKNKAGQEHDLKLHLEAVAKRAGEFAEKFESACFAIACGRWHDLGKNAQDFQDRLAKASDGHEDELQQRVDHSSAGAIYAQQQFGTGLGSPIAFAIAGHHAGLADKVDLEQRLKNKAPRLVESLKPANKVVLEAAKLTAPKFLQGASSDDAQEQKRRYEFWIRMLFSCLVDADFLDTEDHFEGGKHDSDKKSILRGNCVSLTELKSKLDTHLAGFGEPTTPVDEVRARVLADCRERGRTAPQGVFTLTAPTGCGKTLAGMAFALEQAIQHNLDRVIVVLPFTSIIDQNADVYRKVFGPENVIDHHASLDPMKETARNRIACENWDAPIIITTSVQFLESLLANKPSKCRKLHNIAKSVVIFDEVQTLPMGHLIPILDVLKELVRAYRVSLVLSTATQPALQHRKSGLSQVFPGFEKMTEIVSDVPTTFAELKRVKILFPSDTKTHTPWETLAEQVKKEPRVLVVTHQRKDARFLADLIPNSIHLSALMCPAHRLKVIQKIRQLLDDPQAEVRVVSTQLVEAGVDFSFPVVYRALAGFDSVAQAAGRCNRNGELPQLGEVRVFVAESNPPPGTPTFGLEVARTMLTAEPNLDPLDPDLFDRYFRWLYLGKQLDVKGIQSKREGLQFKTVAEEFVVIDENGATPIVVPYGDAMNRLNELRNLGPSRDRLRSLQPFTVSLYTQDFNKLEQAGAIEVVGDTVHAIKCPEYQHLYDGKYGLDLTKPIQHDPSTLTS